MNRRNELLHIKRRTIITVGDLFEMEDDNISSQLIYLNPHVTPHFSKLMARDRLAVKDKKLHSYYISTQGLMIKSSEEGPARAIVSFEQFYSILNSQNDDMVIDENNSEPINVGHQNKQDGVALPKLKDNVSTTNHLTTSNAKVRSKRSKPDSKTPKGNTVQTRLKKHKSTPSHNRSQLSILNKTKK